MLCCVYHPTDNMRVVEDVERDNLLASGFWFDTPNEAKLMRANYERRILDEKQGKLKSKRKTKNDGISSQLEQRVCEEPRSDDSIDGVKSA